MIIIFSRCGLRIVRHVLRHFERARQGDERVRNAIGLARAWARGELTMRQARKAARAGKAAREVTGAARYAALSACQAVAVAHVAAHELRAAADAIRAARAAAPADEQDEAARRECAWQRERLPRGLRAFVLDLQKKRNALCRFVFG